MGNEIDKTFHFHIPSDSGDVLVTGQMWAKDLKVTIPGWPDHAAIYFNFSSELYPEEPIFIPGETLTFLIGPEEDLRIGRHTERGFEEIHDIESDTPTFMQYLCANLLEIALLNPGAGHFDFTDRAIYPSPD